MRNYKCKMCGKRFKFIVDDAEEICLDCYSKNQCSQCGKEFTEEDRKLYSFDTEHLCVDCWERLELEETICCDKCGYEYDRHIGDDCPCCGNNNHEQYLEKYGE